MEPTLTRLTLGASDCGEGFAGSRCPNELLFRQLMSQFGMAMAPPVAAPARTLGTHGLYVGLQTSVTGIDARRAYWQRGTMGGAEAAEEGGNRDLSPNLWWTRFEVRKGLPLGFELGGTIGHGSGTGLWTFGGSLRLAILEGFRDGPMGHLPDLSVRLAVETLVGSPQIHLTVPSLDWTLSKPFALGGTAVLSPLVGLQTVWILAKSDLIDLQPGQDAFGACQPLPGHPTRDSGATTALQCAPGGDAMGYRDLALFEPFSATRWRGFFGAQLQYGPVGLSAVLHVDLVAPSVDADTMPRQVSLLLAGGVGF